MIDTHGQLEAVARHAALLRVQAGIVDQYIKMAGKGGHLVSERYHLRQLRKIAPHRQRMTTGAMQTRDTRHRALFVATVHQYGMPEAKQHASGFKADAIAGTGDEDGFFARHSACVEGRDLCVVVDPHRFCSGVFVHAFHPQIATITGVTNTTKR